MYGLEVIERHFDCTKYEFDVDRTIGIDQFF